MDSFKVFVVDDSALFRTLLRNALTEIPDCEVIGTASDGRTALRKIIELKPDMVTLDVEMPEMDGIAVLQELKRLRIPSKIVMVSRLTSAGAQVTTDALLRGAFDFILKPSSKDPAANRAELAAALLEKVTAIREVISGPIDVVTPVKPVARQAALPNCQAVIIGSSTGGPDALAQVIPYLSPNFPVPVVIVQHMPENFTASLSARLNEASEINVQEASDGLKIQRGMAVVARGGRHLRFERRGLAQIVCQLADDPPEHSCRPAIDYTLRSAVEVFKGPILVVILTGMGRDGTEGCRLAREQGGMVIAQDADGCVVFGMPKSVINAGLADKVVPIVKIPSTIESIVRKCDAAKVEQ